jgi:hypothetical protein
VGLSFGRGNGDDFVLGVILFSSGFGLQHGGFFGGDGECIFDGAIVPLDESREIAKIAFD